MYTYVRMYYVQLKKWTVEGDIGLYCMVGPFFLSPASGRWGKRARKKEVL